MGKIVVILCESADLPMVMASLGSKPIIETIKDSDVMLVNDIFNNTKIGLPGTECPKPKKSAGPKLICNVCNQEFSDKDNVTIVEAKEKDGEIVRALCHIACLSNADFEIIKVIEDKTGKQLKKDFGASKRNEMPELLKDQILSILNEHDVLSLDQILEITDYEDRSLLTGYLWVLKKKGLIESAGRGFYKRVESDGK